MASEKITLASTEPVSLEDTAAKTVPAAQTDVSDSNKLSSSPKSETKGKDEDKTKLETIKASTPNVTEKKDETVKLSDFVSELKQDTDSEQAPPRPLRPVSPLGQIKKDLRDAFPQIEEKYILACLIASGGEADSAFNALLYLLDPTYEPEIQQAPPLPKVPRPKPELTNDELLARQLQKEFDKEERSRRIRASQRSRKASEPQEDDSPDEFEQFKESFSQGFEEAKLTLNSWVLGISKSFTGEDAPADGNGGSNNPKLFGALGGSSFNKNSKPRATNFDDDPEILSLNFQRKLNMDDQAPPVPTKPRPTPNETKWQPLNSDVPLASDAFLLTDSEDEDKGHKKP